MESYGPLGILRLYIIGNISFLFLPLSVCFSSLSPLFPFHLFIFSLYHTCRARPIHLHGYDCTSSQCRQRSLCLFHSPG
ncbi:hypothetical protein BDW71DRAFT_164521 [Aspergillus fruticulosus]